MSARPESSSADDSDGRTRALTYAVDVRREGPRAWVHVTGRLTALARGHLDDCLDWLIETGTRQVTVALATAEQIDDDCLSVLRGARAGLRSRGGEMLVTAGRAASPSAVTWGATAPHWDAQGQPS